MTGKEEVFEKKVQMTNKVQKADKTEDKGKVTEEKKEVNSKKKRSLKRDWRSKMRERYHRPIRIRFHYTECPGRSMPFVWQEFKGDRMQKWDLKDGHTYTLPLGAVLLLKQKQYYRGDIKMEMLEGGYITHQGNLEQRFSIDIFDFISDEDLNRAESLSKSYSLISTSI